MKFLDCSPSKKQGYVDEADQFYQNPKKWLYESCKNKQELPDLILPSHIIFFDVLLKVSCMPVTSKVQVQYTVVNLLGS